jgi:hypothetical protein
MRRMELSRDCKIYVRDILLYAEDCMNFSTTHIDTDKITAT